MNIYDVQSVCLTNKTNYQALEFGYSSIFKGNHIIILIRSYILMIVGNKCRLNWLPGAQNKNKIQLELMLLVKFRHI